MRRGGVRRRLCLKYDRVWGDSVGVYELYVCTRCVCGMCVCEGCVCISRTARQLFELFSALALRSADATRAIAIYSRIMIIVYI